MGFFDKTRFLRTLIFLTPVGLGFILVSIKLLMTSVEDLPKFQGSIIQIENTFKGINFRNQTDLVPVISIKLANSSQDFFTTITDCMETIDRTLEIGDNISIWTHKSRISEIAQIEKQGVIIFPYHKAYGVLITFLLVGIIITFIAVGYLIKYSDDLFSS